MQSIVIGALVIAYICVAYIGPVVAFGLAGYWAYQSVQTGGAIGSALIVFAFSVLLMLIALLIAKRGLRRLMNMVEPDEENASAASEE